MKFTNTITDENGRLIDVRVEEVAPKEPFTDLPSDEKGISSRRGKVRLSEWNDRPLLAVANHNICDLGLEVSRWADK